MGNSILARFWVAMVAMVVVLVLLSGLLLNRMLENTYYKQRAAEMLRQGDYLAKLVAEGEGDAGLTQKLEMAAQLTEFSILVANSEGVIWRSGNYPVGQHSFPRLEAEEIQQIRDGYTVIRRGYSKQLEMAVLGVVVPYGKNDKVEGAVVIQAPLSGLHAFVLKMRAVLFVEALGAILMVSILAYFLARNMARPVMLLAEAAKKMARGQYDITVPEDRRDELGILAKAFNLMAEAVARSIKMQKDFVGNVSHELRTPLSIIKGYAESLLDGMVDDENQKNKHLEIIVDEADRLGRLTSELLDLAQLEGGMLQLKKEEIQLSSFIDRVFGKFAHEAAEKQVVFCNAAAGSIRIYADHDRLFQVFVNLVSNALRFTPAGGVVTIDASVDAAGVEICVGDTGKGMKAEELSRIWERFYTGDESRRRAGGRGLGLAITKSIVEAHGGDIEATSAPEQGAHFVMHIPHRPVKGESETP